MFLISRAQASIGFLGHLCLCGIAFLMLIILRSLSFLRIFVIFNNYSSLVVLWIAACQSTQYVTLSCCRVIFSEPSFSTNFYYKDLGTIESNNLAREHSFKFKRVQCHALRNLLDHCSGFLTLRSWLIKKN